MSTEERPKWTIKNKDHFKCSSCRKYLSVGPIFSSPGCSENYCGRCLDYHHLPRNLLFERLSENVEFPCSVSEECTTPVQWNATQHEKCCPYKIMPCPIDFCNEPLRLKSLLNHLRSLHYAGIINGGDFFLDLKMFVKYFIKDAYYKLIEIGSRQYLAIISINQNYFGINVFDLCNFNSSKSDWFSVVLLAGGTRIKFTTLAEVKQFSFDDREPNYFDQPLNINIRVLNIKHKGSNSIDKLYVSLKFHSSDVSDDMVTLSNSSCMSLIKDAVYCPVCFHRMIIMRVCKRGHTVCEECVNLLKKCPSCQALFTSFRNRALMMLSNFYVKT
ncbi:uncharacterized protein LOC143194093 isoform X4 [Rhynchophorus ferrugineus]|uniref:uncharacterized protein LOC143194093 isoform X2 n=1 Tax=Rhynchophorus ferrugineus TaxID=354439 RepID=UPI003FCE2FE5